MSEHDRNLNSTQSPYEDKRLTSKQRRALQAPSAKDRRRAAIQTQQELGKRVRISRKVVNQQDFGSQLRCWHEPRGRGVADRNQLGALSLTVFDSNQQPLRFMQDHDTESLTSLLEREYEDLFLNTPPLHVSGVRPFGGGKVIHIALAFTPGFIHQERIIVRNLIAPELELDDGHQKEHVSHVSLGKVFTDREVASLIETLTPVVPRRVILSPAIIEVTDITPQFGT